MPGMESCLSATRTSQFHPTTEGMLATMVMRASHNHKKAMTIGARTKLSSADTDTLYQVLRVRETASQREIKAAYRHLAKLYHPDAASSDPQGIRFMEIHNAYATLSDPTTRALYDLSIGGTATAAAGHFTLRRPTRRWETDQCW